MEKVINLNYMDKDFMDLSEKRHELFDEVFSKVNDLYGTHEYWVNMLNRYTDNEEICNLIYNIIDLKTHIAYHFIENGADHYFIRLRNILSHLIVDYYAVSKKSLN